MEALSLVPKAESAVSDELIAKLKLENPEADLRLLVALGQEAVFKTPPYSEYRRFKSMILDPGQRPLAVETLVFGCVVWPATTELRQMINRRPGLVDAFGDKLCEAAGLGAEVVEKKL